MIELTAAPNLTRPGPVFLDPSTIAGVMPGGGNVTVIRLHPDGREVYVTNTIEEVAAMEAKARQEKATTIWVVTHQYDDGHVHRETVMTEYGYFTDEASCEDFIKGKYGHWEESNSMSRPDGYNRYYAEDIGPHEEGS